MREGLDRDNRVIYAVGFYSQDLGRILQDNGLILSPIFLVGCSPSRSKVRSVISAAKFGAPNRCMSVMTLSKIARGISNAGASLFNKWPLNLDWPIRYPLRQQL